MSKKETDIGNVETNLALQQSTADFEDAYLKGIVPETDDPSVPALTFRVWTLGSFWCIILAVANGMGSWRTNPLAIDGIVATLISYPMGIALSKLLPTGRLNPGPFNIKEHVLISVIAAAGAAGAYGVDNVIVQKFRTFMGNQNIGIVESFAWVMTVQFIGFSIAGLTRRFLIEPKAMLFPNVLGSVALFVSLHQPDEPLGRWTMGRFKFFWIAGSIMFVYTWIPQYFVTVLQSVPFICLLTSDKTIRFLASGDPRNGVGLFNLTFDWYYIYNASVLAVPFVWMLNSLFGTMFHTWILVPSVFFLNGFGAPQRNRGPQYSDGTGLRPTLNINSIFNGSGYPIRAVSLYKLPKYDLDEAKYEANKPIYLTEMFALDYLSNFLVLSSMLSYVGLWHGKKIWCQFKSAIRQIDSDEKDIHSILMRAYPVVKEWQWLTFLLFSAIILGVVVSFTHFTMPLWAIPLGIFLCMITVLPIGIVMGVTGYPIYINVLAQIIIGLLIPGNTIGVMAFKSLVTNAGLQAITLIKDLKTSHYLKISPRSMVVAQLFGAFLGAVTTILINWMIMEVPAISDRIGVEGGGWETTGYNSFYNAGAIWGAIGPMRFFGPESPYRLLLPVGFSAGFILPFIPWGINKVYPHKLWKFINIPVIVYVTGAGITQNTIVVPLIIGFIFQYVLMKYQNDWWVKYNYTFAAAVSAGVGFSVFIINFLTAFDFSFYTYALNPTNGFDYYCFDDPFSAEE